MAKPTFLDFSTTPANNTDINGIGTQGTNAVSNFDNAFRELMAILRRDVDGRMTIASKSAGYTAVTNDNNTLIRFSVAATLSLTAAATLGADWHVWVMADGGAVVIDPNSSETINGATTITVPDGTSTLVICDGTNFRALEDYATKLDAIQASVDVASATTTDIGAAASQNVRITGTTTITGLGTVAAGTYRRLRFAAALTLTHNGTSLILPGSANIITTADDTIEAISLGSGNWFLFNYQSRGGIITPWVAYTPTLTGFGTATGITFRSRRVGGNLEVVGRFAAGTSTATEARISIGFNGTDGNVSVNSFMNSAVFVVGGGAVNVTAASQYVMLATGGNAYLRVGLQSSGREGQTPVNGNIALPASGNSLAFSASIPIEGW